MTTAAHRGYRSFLVLTVHHTFTPCPPHVPSTPNSGIPSLTLGYVCTEVPITPDNWFCMPPRGYKKLLACPGLTCYAGNPSLQWDQGNENTGGANASSAARASAPALTPSMRSHFTFITTSEPELMILKVCFCLSRCVWPFPSSRRSKSEAL